MNVNFGLFPPLAEPQKKVRGEAKGAARKKALSKRALVELDLWLETDMVSARGGHAA
jgi:methylenetetrahydrofolate--tRNA-(uracil-5-)-methyltransferase